MKKTITLDLTGCTSLGELHLRMKQAFDFPDFYGQNWSAFWDLLWSECDAQCIVVVGLDALPGEFAWHRERLLTILQRFQEECPSDTGPVELQLW